METISKTWPYKLEEKIEIDTYDQTRTNQLNKLNF